MHLKMSGLAALLARWLAYNSYLPEMGTHVRFRGPKTRNW